MVYFGTSPGGCVEDAVRRRARVLSLISRPPAVGATGVPVFRTGLVAPALKR